MLRRLLPAVYFVSMVGCEGTIIGQGGPDGQRPETMEPFRPSDTMMTKPIVTACTAAPTPGSAPMRRLSHEEYEHAVEDLFGNAALARQVSAGFIVCPARAWIGGASPLGSRSKRPTRTARRHA